MATMNRGARGPGSTIWKVTSRQGGHEWSGPLIAYWEVDRDPISDDYTPQEINAAELLSRWVQKVRGAYPDDLIPIHWFVEISEQGKFERMPFQFHPAASGRGSLEDFLSFYSWPINAQSGEPLNWLTLPVADKRWNSKWADKGGFIQEATGWKPAILQPFVFLPSLTSTRR